jgi:hypothetical protein
MSLLSQTIVVLSEPDLLTDCGIPASLVCFCQRRSDEEDENLLLCSFGSPLS